MKFITITATVVKRIKKDDGTQSIRLAKVFGTDTNPETGQETEVQYKDCWFPFRWNTKNGSQDLKFVEAKPEEVQIWNKYKSCSEVYIQRFSFYIPEWMANNLKPWRRQVQQEILFPNDDDPITVIEQQSADYTQSSIERSQDLGATQTEMFDSPVIFDDSSLNWEVGDDNYLYKS